MISTQTLSRGSTARFWKRRWRRCLLDRAHRAMTSEPQPWLERSRGCRKFCNRLWGSLSSLSRGDATGHSSSTAPPKLCWEPRAREAPHAWEDLRPMLAVPRSLGEGGSFWVSPDTNPKPCLQGWFSTQVWQLVSEQCMPARHWHTVLCVAFPCVFTMRPVSGQRGKVKHRTGEPGQTPAPRPHMLGPV